MQVEAAADHNSAGTQSPPGFAKTIQMASRLAVETQDYLSFATVMDLYLGNPNKFSSEEATEILSELLATLSEYPVIIYQIGWDLMEQLLKYVDHFSGNQMEMLPNQKPFLLLMALFSLLCEKGNPRELLVKACELILTTESDENIKKLAALRLDVQAGGENTVLQDRMEQEGSSAAFENIDMSSQGFEGLDNSQQQNVKFCTLFEVIRFSLQRIQTPYPSSFLLEAAQTLLQVADDPNADLLSMATYARRMFLLARDFNMPGEDSVSQEEMGRVRNILVNFITQTADVVLRKYSLKLTQRLYIQIRNKVALAPPTERDFVYNESEQTRRVSEVISRLAQLLLSYDFDPEEHLYSTMGFRIIPNGGIELVPPVSPTKVEGCEVLADNYWSRKLLEGPSAPGLSILKSQLHFDGTRHKKVDWKDVASHVAFFHERFNASAGCRDIALYWSLWVISNSSVQTFANADLKLMTEWLQALLKLVKTSTSSGEQFVSGSVISRLLRLLPPKFAYDFCIEVMRTSNDPQQQFVVVESLKVLLTGKVTSSADEQTLAQGTDSQQQYSLTSEQKKDLTRVSGDAISRLKLCTSNVAFYYLNFLAVVPTDPEELIKVTDSLDAMCQSCITDCGGSLTPSCSQKLAMLQSASSQLRQLAMRNKSA